jgi:hypothetical protein
MVSQHQMSVLETSISWTDSSRLTIKSNMIINLGNCATIICRSLRGRGICVTLYLLVSLLNPSLDQHGLLAIMKHVRVQSYQANNLLSFFQKANSYFLCVVIPKNRTIKTLSIEYPFLALAILTVSSTTDFALHRLLNERFCHILSTKVIVQGERVWITYSDCSFIVHRIPQLLVNIRP